MAEIEITWEETATYMSLVAVPDGVEDVNEWLSTGDWFDQVDPSEDFTGVPDRGISDWRGLPLEEP